MKYKMEEDALRALSKSGTYADGEKVIHPSTTVDKGGWGAIDYLTKFCGYRVAHKL